MRQGDDVVFDRDEVFDVHLTGDVEDLRAAVVAELVCDGAGLVLDDLQDALFVGQDVLEVGDLVVQFFQFVLDLQDLEAGELTEAVRHDGGSLRVVEAELVHDGLFGFGLAAAAGADGGDDLIDDVDGPGQTF